MTSRWERTFEIGIPLDDVWNAFTDAEFRAKLLTAPPGSRGAKRPQDERQHVLEVDPKKRIRWAQEHEDLPERAEFTVVFEEREGGSRITVTRCGFGEGEVAEVFGKSNGLGWTHGFMDMIVALETGQFVKRHYDGAGLSGMGMRYDEREWGLEVLHVSPDTFASEAGLTRGDRLIRIGGAPVYTRSDLWLLNAVHAPGSELEVEFIRGRELRTGRGRMSPIEAREWGE